MAPVAKRFTISAAGSTSSRGTGPSRPGPAPGGSGGWPGPHPPPGTAGRTPGRTPGCWTGLPAGGKRWRRGSTAGPPLGAPRELPVDLQGGEGSPPPPEGLPVAEDGLLAQLRQPHAPHPAHRSPEAPEDDLVPQPQGLEDLGPLVAGEGGDPHLGQDLQDPRLGGPDPGVHRQFRIRGSRAGEFVRRIGLPGPLLHPAPDGVHGQPGMDGVGAVTQEGAEVVHLPGLPGVQYQGRPGPELHPDEVVVDRPHRQQGAHRYAGLGATPVGKDQEGRAPPDRLFRLGTDPVQGTGESLGTLLQGEGQVQGPGLPPPALQVAEGVELMFPEDGGGEDEPVQVRRCRLQQVLLGAHGAGQGHDHPLPDGVDGRVRDLGEPLLQVVVGEAGPVGEHGQGLVVPHGPDGILPQPDHGLQQEVHLPPGVAEVRIRAT
jgi:hypothetical protein